MGSYLFIIVNFVVNDYKLNNNDNDSPGFDSGMDTDDNNGNTIMIDGTCKESILVLQGKPVRYVSDVQNICRLNGTPPSIDENCLSNACNRTP